MCFFTSLSANAAAVAKRYSKQLDIIEAARQVLAEPQCVIVSGSDKLQVMQWGLIPRTAKPEDIQRYDRENLFKNARAETLFEKWPSRPS